MNHFASPFMIIEQLGAVLVKVKLESEKLE